MTRSLINTVAAAVTITAACHAPAAIAGVHCTEKIWQPILHENGRIFFQTVGGTCGDSWCEINWGTPEKNKNGLSMLMTAKLTDRAVTFYWGALSSCDQKNATYASPGYMMLQ